MNFSHFDKYARYLLGAAILVALLTYWRFWGIDLPSVYDYVAQQSVVHLQTFGNITGLRSVVWDFFGLINKMVMPHSILPIKILGLALTVLNVLLISKILDYMLVERFWGFLCVLLTALSPFSVVAAVSGGAAAVSAVITVLFLAALYKNKYVFAGILSGAAMAANLPGLIMFLIVILDLLQNSADKSKIVKQVLSSATGFFVIVLAIFIYSTFSGMVRIFSVPIGEADLAWKLSGAVPLCIVNALNIGGVVYLIVKKRYDVYHTHFHTLVLWITASALCVVQPSTMNFLYAMIVSTILLMFFLQGFVSVWNFKPMFSETLIFVFAVILLFSDLYTNNKFLKPSILATSVEREEVINRIAAAIMPVDGDAGLVSNFSPAELSVKLGRKVVAVQGGVVQMSELVPVESTASGETSHTGGPDIIYIVQRPSRVDSVFSGCKPLLNASYTENGEARFVQVIKCESNNE